MVEFEIRMSRADAFFAQTWLEAVSKLSTRSQCSVSRQILIQRLGKNISEHLSG